MAQGACFRMITVLCILIIVVLIYGNTQLLKLIKLYILNECILSYINIYLIKLNSKSYQLNKVGPCLRFLFCMSLSTITIGGKTGFRTRFISIVANI